MRDEEFRRRAWVVAEALLERASCVWCGASGGDPHADDCELSALGAAGASESYCRVCGCRHARVKGGKVVYHDENKVPVVRLVRVEKRTETRIVNVKDDVSSLDVLRRLADPYLRWKRAKWDDDAAMNEFLRAQEFLEAVPLTDAPVSYVETTVEPGSA